MSSYSKDHPGRSQNFFKEMFKVIKQINKNSKEKDQKGLF